MYRRSIGTAAACSDWRVGDALGAPVEFGSLDEIRRRCGPSGITDLAKWGGFPAGSFTDDTQMSLAPAVRPGGPHG